MNNNYELKLKRGLRIRASDSGGALSLQLSAEAGSGSKHGGSPCILHWGVCAERSTKWLMPPVSFQPEGTKPAGAAAAQTPFTPTGPSVSTLTFALSEDLPFNALEFVLFFPAEKRWDNNNGKNYRIEFNTKAAPQPEPPAALPSIAGSIHELNHTFDKGQCLYVAITGTDAHYTVDLYTSLTPPVMLHWGVSPMRGGRWLTLTDEVPTPDGSTRHSIAVDSPIDFAAGYGHLHLEFSAASAPPYFTFVLHQPNTGQWLKNNGQNFYVPIAPQQGKIADEYLNAYADEIINAEMGNNSWTLMHRFNLCYGLCERMGGDVGAFALLTVWLRYSAIRQLDWQRNYNTQPRELSHAEDRLTLKLTEIYLNTPHVRPFIPLMLMTMGPGGDGQRIRDEILQIMHRNKIKEVSGHFLEEWHQKLHNNTTADDVVICEAYLAFLHSNGDRGRFYHVLNAGGVTEERLRGFERPIRSHPDFVHHLKDALIYDFGNYLKTLKSVHSSTDLERALRNSSHLFDEEIKNALHFIGQNRDASDPGKIKDLFAASTWVRTRLRQILTNERDLHRAREMLLLDLSLVEFIRLLAERFQHPDKTMLVDLAVLAAGSITPESEELRLCVAHLRGLPPQGASDWVLNLVSAIERLERILGACVEWYYETFQAKAELLGKAFNAAPWTINLFTEELLRGQPPFVLSLLLKRLNQVLRKEYNLGIWQVVSPFEAMGRVVAVDTLYEIQDKAYDTSTVIVAGKVSGDEEIPSGVTAVISPDMTDIVSHVAVRARNARILFATCYDAATLDSLRAMSGRYAALAITQSGDVAFTETSAPAASDKKATDSKYVLQSAHFKFTNFALPMKEFNRQVAGGKSNNLAALRGKVPEWINLPPSVVVPFGTLECVLGMNPDIDAQYKSLLNNVTPESLTQLRALIGQLTIPDEFIAALEGVMADAGISYSASDTPLVAERIKQVWASLWNERAYLSRVKNFAGNPHAGISMAVLIQEIVNAEYAFVIHTVNPVTGATDEVFAEVVPGLGETLVGNHPGRALSFTCKKDAATPKVASYPSKGIALYGEGLIFRSDSNVEDLSGFAGAGLYDSITMRAPREVLPDYSTMPLLRDEQFRNDILSKIRDIGVIVESAFGCPQDIEGAYAHGRYYVVQSRPQVGV
ncbi:MAG: hypothetical protein HQL01_08445 [Nitrospirae bacterium]|nr:hypothetical protein [Nitrospirota bacterium]